MKEMAQSADYSLRILWSLARWLEDHKGKAALAAIATEAGVSAEDFDGSTRWVSHAQLELILRRARELVDSDEAFKDVFAYRFKESYGAFRYMIWAVSFQKTCEMAAKLSESVMCHVAKFEILKSERNAFRFRYRSSRPETRLICLSRQVPWTIGPTVWGLPPAQLTEHSCIANGDECCEYDVRWFERSRILPVAAGALVGGILAAALSFFSIRVFSQFQLAAFAFPLLGASIAYALELRRTSGMNLSFAQELNTALRDVGGAEAETRSEIAALHQRQRDWMTLMEEQVSERTRALEQIVGGLNELQQSRFVTLRGFSHDIRNPLFVVRGNAQFLLERTDKNNDEQVEALRDMETAAVQMEAMLSKLMEVANQESGVVKLAPAPILVPPLADILRRRLRALVHGRDIKVSVFCMREAPDEIVCDPLVFDRVIDNLLTNAAKYTERGSIILEIGGTPGSMSSSGNGEPVDYLTLKLSDTGHGISHDKLDRIFRPRSSSEPSSPRSYGIGLSSVVRLLAQIGGRIDVMSKLELGTTFWAHFPKRPPAYKPEPISEDNLENMISHVVTVRRESA